MSDNAICSKRDWADTASSLGEESGLGTNFALLLEVLVLEPTPREVQNLKKCSKRSPKCETSLQMWPIPFYNNNGLLSLMFIQERHRVYKGPGFGDGSFPQKPKLAILSIMVPFRAHDWEHGTNVRNTCKGPSPWPHESAGPCPNETEHPTCTKRNQYDTQPIRTWRNGTHTIMLSSRFPGFFMRCFIEPVIQCLFFWKDLSSRCEGAFFFHTMSGR